MIIVYTKDLQQKILLLVKNLDTIIQRTPTQWGEKVVQEARLNAPIDTGYLRHGFSSRGKTTRTGGGIRMRRSRSGKSIIINFAAINRAGFNYGAAIEFNKGLKEGWTPRLKDPRVGKFFVQRAIMKYWTASNTMKKIMQDLRHRG